MGQLVNGTWQVDPPRELLSDGRFRRKDATFRNWVTSDGSPGPTGKGGFRAESGRYHLYISYACPWAHRTLILRHLKGLEKVISVSIVDHFLGDEGWTFASRDGGTGDTLFGSSYLHQIYTRADPEFTGRVTVPVLWDRLKETIVSNESSEIIRMLNRAFNGVGANGADFYPEHLQSEIDAINIPIYENINNGVYRCGFAGTQEAYEEAFHSLFDCLDMVEGRLARHRYLIGNRLSEADWRLFTTLVRFDPVYHYHFKCNRQRINDFACLSNYTRELYQIPGIAETVNMHHIKNHYYASHESINPARIVPLGPEVDFLLPHDRDQFSLSVL